MSDDVIKVGDYVRNFLGEIYKVNDLTDYCVISDKFYGNIIKHSDNIIDLIEVGDYVNGYKVIGVTLDSATSGKYIDIDCNMPSYESYLFKNEIKSILTKEQYKNNCYKVVE